MQDSTRYGKVVYLGQLSASSKTDFGKRAFSLQCPEQKVFSATWELESLVGNGGFEGYFGNGAETASYAPTALRALGAPLTAAIVEEALALLPPSLPTDQACRWEAVHSLPEGVMERFESLNRRYFADPEKVMALLYAFVSARPEVFGPTPEETSLPAPPPAPTPAECDAALQSLLDLMEGGPEALVKCAGGGVRLEELPPEAQKGYIELAQLLRKEAEEFKAHELRRESGGGEDDLDRKR